jgi:hypothetical protein
MVIAVATFGIESAALGERLEKRGLPATVFSDEERHVGPKRQIDSAREGADIERVAGGIDLFRQGDYAP